ncbi:hypothetical protein [Bittarella massiliensis (ex Durand et al. 2017)]|uniref:Uncharacterized protein n=1 Tax=Bittarella massiliensis (ex Durand et al. 2017) TaxID=1720313 RepID=A0AAW5KCQ9_9FIRM|nr:hypothetical protein [Bittarella massiliensis (ex Durand et al. 2017)]MCQ4948253.1 hypothetical protein [Bittarella massiliensis (ex Durand et al. 2017)]
MKRFLDEDIKHQAIWIVRGYQASLQRYREKRQQVLLSACDDNLIGIAKNAEGVSVEKENGNGQGVRRTGQELKKLESLADARRIAAVEQARKKIGCDLKNQELQKRLTEAIMLNCENGRQYPYERLGIDEIGRTNFYERRASFLKEVAILAGVL